MVYQEWSQEDLQNFSAIVTSAIGLNTTRGDKITIKNMEFIQEDLTAVEQLMRERENRELIKNIAKYLSIGLVVSLFFSLLFVLLFNGLRIILLNLLRTFFQKHLKS